MRDSEIDRLEREAHAKIKDGKADLLAALILRAHKNATPGAGH